MRKDTKNILLYCFTRLIIVPLVLLCTILIFGGLALLIPLHEVIFALFIVALIIELIAWITWVIIGFKQAKEPLSSIMKRISIGVCTFYCVVTFIGYQMIFGDKCIGTERSPCGKYTTKIYVTGGLFYMTMPGDGGNRPLKIVLKDRWGRTIGTETEITNSLETEWDYNYNILWTSRGNGIDFK